MTKEKRMEPPRLSLVPSSQESNDNARDDAGDEPLRASTLPRNVAAARPLPFPLALPLAVAGARRAASDIEDN